MLSKFFSTLAVIGSTMIGSISFATKSCSPESFYSNQGRGNKEWIKISTWAAEVKVTEVNHKWVPYPNCYAEDKSKCEKKDVGTFEAVILKVLKGEIRGNKFVFKEGDCSKGIPKTKGEYIFYGRTMQTYDGYWIL